MSTELYREGRGKQGAGRQTSRVMNGGSTTTKSNWPARSAGRSTGALKS